MTAEQFVKEWLQGHYYPVEGVNQEEQSHFETLLVDIVKARDTMQMDKAEAWLKKNSIDKITNNGIVETAAWLPEFKKYMEE